MQPVNHDSYSSNMQLNLKFGIGETFTREALEGFIVSFTLEAVKSVLDGQKQNTSARTE